MNSKIIKNKSYRITVVGSGYVGMSLAVLLAQQNNVTVLDINIERISKINAKMSTVNDNEIENFLEKKDLNLKATIEKEVAYKNADFVIIAVPTNYDFDINGLDTSELDSVVKDAISLNPKSTIVIKSTIPIGYTSFLQKKHNTKNIFFSPEFMREGSALTDNLYPSRIIIGSHCKNGKIFANLLTCAAKKQNIKTHFVSSSEAESIKLFANSYLAMRVSFFNELDSFALSKGLDTKNIIDGLSSDKRIGEGYNNPSFGYGGYCLQDRNFLLQ